MSVCHEGPRKLLLFYCPEFDELILRKSVRIVATRCEIFRLKCTKFPTGGAYSAPPDPLAAFKGPYL